ncbi:hypothetical protein QN096_23465 [Metapseudomonas otitidis]|uniref:hypothetical protein n=1 Tax=Metapseudomonas otitidis TaxID=319939 RepID=UPI0025419EB1|nr:hypothetical protein [Pseudomonas otitidis]WIF66693.1 hypothetical protein QN096_23465 [Pseudomonas otitidis]
MKTGHLYSVSDKALFDALNNSKLTNQEIIDIFFSRGILISKETKRKDLALYFSRLTHGYHDFEFLSEILGAYSRKEKSTSCDIPSTVKKEDVVQAAHELCKKINSEGNTADTNILPNGDIEIVVKYQKLNLDKSELRQTVNKEATLIIEPNKAGFTLRAPLNEDVNSWKEDLLQKIQEEAEEELEFNEISLEHISDHKLRTEFFTELIKKIGNYDLLDVTDAYVYHPKESNSAAPGFDSDDDSEDDEVDFGVHISKASLKGEGVLQSEELHSLYAKGFYIWRIIWRCKEPAVGSDQIELEAQFAEPESCTEFSYIAKGFYKYKSQGAYSKNRTQLSYSAEKDLLQKLENKARETIKKISQKALSAQEEEDEKN